MSRPDRLHAAVVGLGFIGPQHVDAIRRTGYAEVVALVGRDPERTAVAARSLGVPRSYDLDDVLGDADVDVIHVCTPNATHVEFALASLAAGKHVVVEKPVAIDRAGATALVAAAARAQRHAAVALTYRGYPMVRRARELVRSGRIGALRMVHGGYLQDWLSDPTDYNWRLEADAGGPSRAFGDIGTHWFDTAEFISGARTEAVLADMATFVPVRHRPVRANTAFASSTGATEEVHVDTEDAATVLVRFAGGARGTFLASQVSPGHKNDLTVEVSGSERSLGWAQEDPERLWLRSRSESVLLSRGAPADGETIGAPSLPAGHPEGWGEALRDLLRSFYGAIAADSPPPSPRDEAPYPTLVDGARAVALIEGVVESARSGTWATVRPIEPAVTA